MVNIVHNDYERIADMVHDSRDWNMRFILLLNYYTKNNEQFNFHREVQYSNKNNANAISINRDFNYFFEISTKEKDSNGMKMSVRISNMDFFLFRDRLNGILSDIKTKDMFVNIKDKLTINSRETYRVNLIFGNYIEFEPAVHEWNNMVSIGLFMYINNEHIRVFIPINEFYYLINTLNEFNMFIAAQNMMNYLGRPENGTNLFSFNDTINRRNEDSRSFFNKVNANRN